MRAKRMLGGLMAAIGCATLALGSGCAPITGQMAEGGYTAAKSALGALSPTAAGADERQKRLQATFNEIDVGDDIQPVLKEIGEAPREKSGNAQGYTCYEFPSVYSGTDAAVLMALDGKIVFTAIQMHGRDGCRQLQGHGQVRA